MKRNHTLFYIIVLLLIVVNSLLLSSPNLLGKVGLVLYRYHYLRTFPRTLLTVGSVCGVAVLISWLVVVMTEKRWLTRRVSLAILSSLLVTALLILGKVVQDFTAWSYAHTGMRFRLGAYALPVVLMIIFAQAIVRVVSIQPLEVKLVAQQDDLEKEREHESDHKEDDEQQKERV